MNAYVVTAVVVILSVFLTVFRNVKGDFSLVASCVVCLILVAISLTSIFPLIDYISGLEIINGYESYFSVILKSVGTAVICTTASEICKDTGQGALAFGVETFCKCEIVAMSLPMIKGVLELAKEIMT